jgi:hypothetical protein
VQVVEIIYNKFREFLCGNNACSEGVQQQGLGEKYLDLRANVTG